jgi:hypothetical protein
MKQRLSVRSPIQGFACRHRLKTRTDADGTLIIPGKFGHIYQYDEHRLAVLVLPPTCHRRYWCASRRRLSNLGFTIVQNGDCEGAAVFTASDHEQTRAAIKAAGIKRKRQLSPAQINRQISWLRASAGRAL